MPNKFISNNELIKLLDLATEDEKLALSKLLDNSKKKAYNAKTLQKKICEEGGHDFANWWRGQGTGYLDIVDDVAEALEIKRLPSYNTKVAYYDEIDLLKYSKEEAIQYGLEYAKKAEQQIIIRLIEKSYEFLVKQKNDAMKELADLKKKLEKNESLINNLYDDILSVSGQIKLTLELLSLIDESNKEDQEYKITLEEELLSLKNNEHSIIKDIEIFEEMSLDATKEIVKTNEIIKEKTKQIEQFDNQINEVVNQFDSSNTSTLTGTAGLMVLANLGGFATYTFLTSAMSIISMGTLGFGAYTAATSLLSIIIGPVGWAGLGFGVLYSLGKPKLSKTIPIVATIGAIRQRVLYEKMKMSKIK